MLFSETVFSKNYRKFELITMMMDLKLPKNLPKHFR